MAPTVYLVSGANRGIGEQQAVSRMFACSSPVPGLGFVSALAVRPNVIVFAGARDPSSAAELKSLELKYPDIVHVVKLSSADRTDNTAAVAEIERAAGRLDVIIANAGIAAHFGPGVETREEVMLEHFKVNAIGPLVLFQHAHSLLSKSPAAKFVLISSGAGSISTGASMPVGMLAYGTSKAAANYAIRKLSFEHPSITIVMLSPGAVATDMAAFAAAQDPMMGAVDLITVEQSVAGCLGVVDAAVREEGGPRMKDCDGSMWEW